jgi:glyoxylase I family protein
MITQIAHVCIGARDLAESQRFYCDVLGIPKKFDFIKNEQLFGFYLGVGNNTFIEVFEEGQETLDGQAMIKHLCLEVDDIDAVIERVTSQGWEVTQKKRGCDQTWQAWITDPSGVRIELHQYTEQSSQFTGTDCLVDW